MILLLFLIFLSFPCFDTSSFHSLSPNWHRPIGFPHSLPLNRSPFPTPCYSARTHGSCLYLDSIQLTELKSAAVPP